VIPALRTVISLPAALCGSGADFLDSDRDYGRHLHLPGDPAIWVLMLTFGFCPGEIKKT
jgi:hypothetical protein